MDFSCQCFIKVSIINTFSRAELAFAKTRQVFDCAKPESAHQNKKDLPVKLKFEKYELALLGAVLALLVVAIVAPAVAQSATHHNFADQRAWGWIPFAADVLSNLPFLIWGGLGLTLLARQARGVGHRTAAESRGLTGVFFGGLVVTAFMSSFYHWQPDNAGLAFDRLGMVVAFAGLMGLAAAGRVSARAGELLALAVLLLGPLAVWVWSSSGNVLPWAVLQFGGMGLVLCLAWLKPLPGALAIRWGWVIVIYAVAKGFEMADEAVFAATAQLVSGHSLKHVVASFAAWPVVFAMLTHHKSRAEFATRLRVGKPVSPSRYRRMTTQNQTNEKRSQA
jgi:hypothetical protein